MRACFSSKAVLIFAVVSSFFLYQLYYVIKSIPFTYWLSVVFADSVQSRGFWWTIAWVFSETSGSIGSFLGFASALIALAVAYVYLAKGEIDLSRIRKAIILEALYYLFYIPFIVFLFVYPISSVPFSFSSYTVAISYSAQVSLIFPALIVLSQRIKQFKMDGQRDPLLRWIVIAGSCYIFALWIKHFALTLYAIGFRMNVANVIGFANSAFTLLVAALATLTLLNRTRSNRFSEVTIGWILTCIGAYFIIFVAVSMADQFYFSFLQLTEIWAITLPVLGLRLIRERKKTKRT